jgi:hypothetical protein
MYVKIQRQTPLALLLTVEIEWNCQVYIYIYKLEVGYTNIISSRLLNHFRTWWRDWWEILVFHDQLSDIMLYFQIKDGFLQVFKIKQVLFKSNNFTLCSKTKNKNWNFMEIDGLSNLTSPSIKDPLDQRWARRSMNTRTAMHGALPYKEPLAPNKYLIH